MIFQTNTSKLRYQSIVFIASVYIVASCAIILDICLYVTTSKQFGLIYVFEYSGFYCLYYILVTHELFFWHTIYLINIKIIKLNEILRIRPSRFETFNLKCVNHFLDTFKVKPLKQILVSNFEIPFELDMDFGRFTNDCKCKL